MKTHFILTRTKAQKTNTKKSRTTTKTSHNHKNEYFHIFQLILIMDEY